MCMFIVHHTLWSHAKYAKPIRRIVLYVCSVYLRCKKKESYIIHLTWNSILIEFPFNCKFFEMFRSNLPALEEWRKDASAVRYHYCFSNCQHDDTWSIQSNCVAIIVLLLHFNLLGNCSDGLFEQGYTFHPAAALLICTLPAQYERREQNLNGVY